MSQSALTSPLLTLIPTRMARWSRTLESSRGRSSGARPADVIQMPNRTRTHRVLDTDPLMAHSRIFVGLR